jgi:hypothetical protein
MFIKLYLFDQISFNFHIPHFLRIKEHVIKGLQGKLYIAVVTYVELSIYFRCFIC